MELYLDSKKKKSSMIKQGLFINTQLCFNADTFSMHIEWGSSYHTIMVVPNNEKIKTKRGFENIGKSELMTKSGSRFVIDLSVRVIFRYLAFGLFR